MTAATATYGDELVPYAEAGAELGNVKHRTIARYCERGWLVRVRLGREMYVTRKSLEEYKARVIREATHVASQRRKK